jgi:hypothetical protein
MFSSFAKSKYVLMGYTAIARKFISFPNRDFLGELEKA